MKESVTGAVVPKKPSIDESCYYRWAEPNSAVTVCLRLDTMDRLQIEVLRGIGPHGGSMGNEVGGVLLGRIERDNGRIVTFVDDFEAVPCEHRSGPPYVLTAKDAINFESAVARGNASPGHSVVGYYRSHNRNGLFLSPDDVRVIHRYFREPDNLFLLIKTLPSRACTAGFFFWKDGHLQSEFTDSEAPLIPVSFSTAGQSFPSGEPGGTILVGPPGPFPSSGREHGLVTAGFEPGSNRHHGLIGGVVLALVAIAATIAVVRYQTPQTAHRSEGLETHGATAQIAVPEAPAVRGPASISKHPQSSISNLKTVSPPARNKAAAPPRGEPKPPAPAPAPEARAVVSPIGGESNIPPSAKTPAAPVEAPASALPGVRAETRTAPPIAATQLPLPENPAPPPTAAVATEAGTSAPRIPPPAPAPARTYIGPRVIHQVAPAVPRGVGPMITTDVHLEVEVAIDATGKVTSARVASTKGTAAGLLTLEALKAAQLFRFEPAQENGRNVASVTVLTFRFDRIKK